MRFKCRKTHGYPTQVQAEQAIDELARKREQQRNEHRESRAYFCNICLAWHLTSEPQRTRRG